MTSREKQRTALLAKLRSDPRLWDDTPKAEQISRMIQTAKRLNAPEWKEQARVRQEKRLNEWFNIQ